jgi:hypothetical protein
MITPAYGMTATERVLPRLALDFTTGALDPRVTVARALNTATRVNSSGLIEIINANLPRFDYDPVTLAPKGLLIEESRTNLMLQSQAIDQSPWAVSQLNTTGTPAYIDVAASPDGTQNADKLIPNTVSTQHYAQQAITLARQHSIRTDGLRESIRTYCNPFESRHKSWRFSRCVF